MRGLTLSANIYGMKWSRDVCEWRSAGRRVNNAHAEELMLSADSCLEHKTLCNLVLFLHFSTVCSSATPLRAFRLFTKLTLTWYFHFYSNMSVGCFYQPCVIHWFPVPKYLNNTVWPDPAHPAKLQPPEDWPVTASPAPILFFQLKA